MSIPTFFLYALLVSVNISSLIFFLKDDRRRYFGNFVHWGFVGMCFVPTISFCFPLFCSPLSLFLTSFLMLVVGVFFLAVDDFFSDYILFFGLYIIIFVLSVMNLLGAPVY
jgi:hypothetical protein